MKKIKRVFSLVIGFIMGLSVKLYAASSVVQYVPEYGVATKPRYRSIHKYGYEIAYLILKVLGIVLIPLIFLEGYNTYKEVKNKGKPMKYLVFTLLLIYVWIIIFIILMAKDELLALIRDDSMINMN